MKRNQLKALVKEIVTQVMAEMPQQTRPESYLDVQDWNMIDDNMVEFKGVLLPDNREVNIFVEFTGNWDDSAFGYTYGNIKGTHRSEPAFEVNRVRTTSAVDSKTEQDMPLDQSITTAGEALFHSYQEEILDKLEPPQ